MKIILAHSKSRQILLAVLLILMMPFQGFAYKAEIITPNLPEAVIGSFYSVQLLSEGLGRNAVWSAEGLPQGLELNPLTGMLYGTVYDAGTYDITVTAGRMGIWRRRQASKLFRLNVLRLTGGAPEAQPPATVPPASIPPAEAPTAPTTPTATPQTDAAVGDLSGAPLPPSEAVRVEWRKLRANGISGTETTTHLFLEFSRSIPNFTVESEAVDYIEIDNGNIEIKSACAYMDGESYVVELEISEIPASFGDGDEAEVCMYNPFNVVIVNPDDENAADPVPRRVALNVRSVDLEKAESDANALTIAALLGENASENEITSDLSLPDRGAVNGCNISWLSGNSGIISNSGEVTRPDNSAGDAEVTLTATVVSGGKSAVRDFLFNVKALPSIPPVIPPANSGEESLPQALPSVSASATRTGSLKSASAANDTGTESQIRTSSNVNKNGAVSRVSVISELKSAMKSAEGDRAVIKTQNAQSLDLKALKAFAGEAFKGGKELLLHADTLTERGGVDARLYIKPSSFLEFDRALSLNILTKGKRADAARRLFERFFENEVSVISCAQRGGFGAKLQIAAKVRLPEDTGNLVFYSYDSESNSYSRIITAYRIDANGYLRFVTEKAGDIIVSGGVLKKRD